LKPTDIIAALRAKDPKILGDVADKRAEQILKAALTHIRESIVAAEKGDHPVAMLGRFKVNEVAKGEGAEATTVRKVVFIAAKPAENKEGEPGDKAAGAGKGPKAPKAKA
jgi:nucleoid DNA-binding protein